MVRRYVTRRKGRVTRRRCMGRKGGMTSAFKGCLENKGFLMRGAVAHKEKRRSLKAAANRGGGNGIGVYDKKTKFEGLEKQHQTKGLGCKRRSLKGSAGIIKNHAHHLKKKT